LTGWFLAHFDGHVEATVGSQLEQKAPLEFELEPQLAQGVRGALPDEV
jgi:hypothetical protein